jgi:hypothetical protein
MKKFSFLLFAPLLLLFGLFFVGGTDEFTPRSLKIAWNFGHVIFFAIAVYLLLQLAPITHRKSPLSQFLLIIGLCLMAGILIESIQFMIGRQASWGDVFRNILGGLVALIFFPHRQAQNNVFFGRLAKAIVTILVGIQLVPLALALVDEQMARSQFPMLANFESQLELSRWESDANITLDSNFVINGDKSARIEFTTEKYSGLSTQFMPPDWKNYERVLFSSYLPGQAPLILSYRIHDRQHEQGDYLYHDRFNRRVLLQPGWNHISAELTDVFNAPRTRQMDMGSIANIHFYVSNQKQPRVIYLDNLRLE